MIGDASAVPVLSTILNEKDSVLRYVAIKALGAIGDPSAMAALVGVLHDRDSLMRGAAAEALGAIGDPSAIPALEELLDDNESYYEPGFAYAIPPRVNQTARSSLVEIEFIQRFRRLNLISYSPKEVNPGAVHRLFVYLSTDDVANEVESDARASTGESTADYRGRSEKSRYGVARGASVRVVPELEGFEFRPPAFDGLFDRDWQRIDFELVADESRVGKASNGAITFAVEEVIIGELPLSIYVGCDTAGGHAKSSRKPYQAIFCSYSRRDEDIVRRVEAVCKLLGFDYIIDKKALKSGQRWEQELARLIEKSDIFQLFWSKNAASSKNVEKEWRYALGLDRESTHFIRPVYWKEPVHPCPKELSHLHFAFAGQIERSVAPFVDVY